MMFGDVHLKAIGDVLRSSSVDHRGHLPREARDALAELWLDAQKKTNEMHIAARRLAARDPNGALQASDETWYIYGQLRLSMERQKDAFVLLNRMLHSLDNNFYGMKGSSEGDTMLNSYLPRGDLEGEAGYMASIASARISPAEHQLRAFFSASNSAGLFPEATSTTFRMSDESVPLMHIGSDGPPNILQFLFGGQSRRSTKADSSFPMPAGQFTARAFVARTGDDGVGKASSHGALNATVEGGSGEKLPLSPEISEIEPPIVTNGNYNSHGIY